MRFFSAVVFVIGCSGKVIEASPVDSGVAVDSATDTMADAPIDDTACLREADKFATALGGTMCTTTVRISQVDFSLLGVQTFCGKFSGTLVDEAAARAALASFPKYVKIEDFSVVESGTRDAPWIFGHGAGDFGGLGAVDARTGLPVYFAMLSWSAMGEVALPKNTAPLPLVCEATSRHPYTVVSMGDARPSTDAQAMAMLERTPILRGIERVHAIGSITLLHVPLDGSYSDAGPPQNEWVAMIESVLLE
ncbi:MAG: hypothetical protein ACXWUG_05805 [Polyangiales bacterium]